MGIFIQFPPLLLYPFSKKNFRRFWPFFPAYGRKITPPAAAAPVNAACVRRPGKIALTFRRRLANPRSGPFRPALAPRNASRGRPDPRRIHIKYFYFININYCLKKYL
jgi:hypothetical protein